MLSAKDVAVVYETLLALLLAKVIESGLNVKDEGQLQCAMPVSVNSKNLMKKAKIAGHGHINACVS